MYIKIRSQHVIIISELFHVKCNYYIQNVLTENVRLYIVLLVSPRISDIFCNETCRLTASQEQIVTCNYVTE